VCRGRQGASPLRRARLTPGTANGKPSCRSRRRAPLGSPRPFCTGAVEYFGLLLVRIWEMCNRTRRDRRPRRSLRKAFPLRGRGTASAVDEVFIPPHQSPSVTASPQGEALVRRGFGRWSVTERVWEVTNTNALCTNCLSAHADPAGGNPAREFGNCIFLPEAL